MGNGYYFFCAIKGKIWNQFLIYQVWARDFYSDLEEDRVKIEKLKYGVTS